MSPITSLIFAALVLGNSPVPVNAPARAQSPGPEHARLTALVGTWDVELTFTFQPGSPPVVAKGTSTIRSLFDGSFIEERSRAR